MAFQHAPVYIFFHAMLFCLAFPVWNSYLHGNAEYPFWGGLLPGCLSMNNLAMKSFYGQGWIKHVPFRILPGKNLKNVFIHPWP